MYSKNFKLRMLKKFYETTNLSEMESQCPFGKNYRSVGDPVMANVNCMDLCGTWLELGDVRRGCPCFTLGKDVALLQLHKILKREGMLNGKDE